MRIGQYCTEPFVLFAAVFTTSILNFLSIQNILFRKGTALFQFNEGTASHATQHLREQVSLMGSKEASFPRGLRRFLNYLGPLGTVSKSKFLVNDYFPETKPPEMMKITPMRVALVPSLGTPVLPCSTIGDIQ